LSLLTAVILSLSLVTGSACAESRGYYVGRVIAEWSNDGHRMILRAPFEYVAPDQRKWRVPAGVIVDGATIPQFLWSITGGPFEGKYRDASVIHDHFCSTKTRAFQDVHRVFFHAMLTSGVSQARAWLMYKAVEKFGPYWDPPKINPRCLRSDGKIDYELCTENSLLPPGPTRWPRRDRADVLRFLEDMAGTANPADLAALRKAIDQR
jgi:hypothetical protein